MRRTERNFTGRVGFTKQPIEAPLPASIRLLTAVELFERLELLDQGLVLVLEHGHPILQAFDVLLLLASALARRLAVLEQPQLALLQRRLRRVPLVAVVPAAARRWTINYTKPFNKRFGSGELVGDHLLALHDAHVVIP